MNPRDIAGTWQSRLGCKPDILTPELTSPHSLTWKSKELTIVQIKQPLPLLTIAKASLWVQRPPFHHHSHSTPTHTARPYPRHGSQKSAALDGWHSGPEGGALVNGRETRAPTDAFLAA